MPNFLQLGYQLTPGRQNRRYSQLDTAIILPLCWRKPLHDGPNTLIHSFGNDELQSIKIWVR